MSDTVRPPACADDERRADLVQGPFPPQVDLNGIDFVEVDPTDHAIVRVSFLKPIPAGAYGILGDPTRVDVRRRDAHRRDHGARGGDRVARTCSELEVGHGDDPPYAAFHGGDWSPYVLTLPDDPGLDPVKRSTVFSFMAGCPTDVDCRPPPCPPRGAPSSRSSTTWRRTTRASAGCCSTCLPTLNPDWVERNPSDLGDRAARAARLRGRPALLLPGRGRERGVPRHAAHAHLGAPPREARRLPDARRPQRLGARASSRSTSPGTLPRGTALFTKLTAPLRGQTAPPPTEIAAGRDHRRRPRSATRTSHGVVAFETAFDQALAPGEQRDSPAHLGRGGVLPRARHDRGVTCTTSRTGRHADGRPAGAEGRRLPRARGGRRPAHGRRRPTPIPSTASSCGSRGTPEQTTDPLYTDHARRRRAADPAHQGDAALPLLHVRWRRADALAFPLCLSSRDRRRTARPQRLGGARERRPRRPRPHDRGDADAGRAQRSTDGSSSRSAPLTMECRPDAPTIDPAAAASPIDRPELDCDVRARAAGAGADRRRRRPEVEPWLSVPDLLDSPAARQPLRRGGRRRRPRHPPLRRRRVRPRAPERRRARFDGGLPRRQRPRRQRRRGGDRPRRRPRRRGWIASVSQPARRRAGHRPGDDRGGPPARAAGVPHRALPRGHRGGLGRAAATRWPASPARWPRTAGRGAGTRSSSPSTRATAPTSSTSRTAARGSSRRSSSACARS